MDVSRTAYATKNFLWATVGNLVTLLLSLVSRTVFIFVLGTTYLGVSGLFSNVLGMLSFAELGFGAAISFSLYKPLAERDEKKVWAIIHLYKIVYRVVAAIVLVAGLAIIPFLDIFVKGGEGIERLTLIYIIYLFNTVTSYLITYKVTVLEADQRTYLITNINTIVRIITVVIQIFVIFIFRNFLVYLIVESIIQLVSKLYLNHFTNKKYPYLKEKSGEELSKEEKKVIFDKVKALAVHKVGEVSVYQTDSIITSSLINVTTVGLVSNFTLIINYINKFIVAFFSAAVAGLGNLIATEDNDKLYQVFKKYDFLGFVLFSFTSICLYFLLSPFITVWIGEDKLVDDATVFLLTLNYYILGQRISVGNMKGAAGVYEPDAWMSIAEAILNVVISIYGAYHWGLKGVYIGTIVSGFVPTFGKPFVLYKYVLKRNSISYYVEFFKRLVIMAGVIFIIKWLSEMVVIVNPYVELVYLLFLSVTIPLLAIYVIYRKTDEMKYVISTIRMLLMKIKRQS